jgi:hypothetical protein
MTALSIPLLRSADVVRYHEKVAKQGLHDCWPWLAGKTEPGYGAFYLSGRMFQAHRIALHLSGGRLTEDQVVDHVCRNRACVNPAHLRAVSRYENVHENSEARAHFNSLKTHCPHGHPYSGDNLIVRSSGRRQCRACKMEDQRRRRSVGEADGGPVAESDAPKDAPTVSGVRP